MNLHRTWRKTKTEFIVAICMKVPFQHTSVLTRNSEALQCLLLWSPRHLSSASIRGYFSFQPLVVARKSQMTLLVVYLCYGLAINQIFWYRIYNFGEVSVLLSSCSLPTSTQSRTLLLSNSGKLISTPSSMLCIFLSAQLLSCQFIISLSIYLFSASIWQNDSPRST